MNPDPAQEAFKAQVRRWHDAAYRWSFAALLILAAVEFGALIYARYF